MPADITVGLGLTRTPRWRSGTEDEGLAGVIGVFYWLMGCCDLDCTVRMRWHAALQRHARFRSKPTRRFGLIVDSRT